MISNHIEDLIVAAKAKPNSVWRNKTVSALLTALAAAKMDEMDTESALSIKRQESVSAQATGHVPTAGDMCTCSPGMVNTMCRVHGKDLLNPQPRVQ